MWATSDFVPRSELLGTPRRQGLYSHLAHLWVTSDFVPHYDALGILQAAGDGGGASIDEASTTPLDPVPPSSIPSGIVVATPSSDHPTSHAGCPSAEEILADVCRALFDSQGSFHPSLLEVEALLGNISGQFEFEVRHIRDLTTESYVPDCSQIVVCYWWAAQTALRVDWGTMGVELARPLLSVECLIC